MKSFLIIGLGKFGHHLCQNLAKTECEIMIIDINENKVEDLLPYVTNAKVGDCTNPEVLENLGVTNFDVCFVCISENFQNSLEATSLVKEMGARYVVSLACRDIHSKFLLKNGADFVIYPDRDIAERMAKRFSKNSLFDYIEIDSEFGIYEIPPFEECIGKTIKEVNFRARYSANIIGYKKNGKTHVMPGIDYVFKESEHLIVVGKNSAMDRLIK